MNLLNKIANNFNVMNLVSKCFKKITKKKNNKNNRTKRTLIKIIPRNANNRIKTYMIFNIQDQNIYLSKKCALYSYQFLF